MPSFNAGPILVPTVRGALGGAAPHPVWVAVDGSTDKSPMLLEEVAIEAEGRLSILTGDKNRGKGAAVYRAARLASEMGFTHALTMDSDGQHPAGSIREFFRLGEEHPEEILMGQPIFGPDAPLERRLGRRIGNFFTALETPGADLGDGLFGMRLYPLGGLLKAFEQTRFGRGFDFDPEIAVRMSWLGYRVRRVPVPVRYLSKREGGVSHYRYVGDNLAMAFLHLRLMVERLRLCLGGVMRH